MNLGISNLDFIINVAIWQKILNTIKTYNTLEDRWHKIP